MLQFPKIIKFINFNLMPKAQKKWVKILWIFIAIATILSMVLWTVQL